MNAEVSRAISMNMKKSLSAALIMGLLSAGSAFALDLNGMYAGASLGEVRGPLAAVGGSTPVTRQSANLFVGNQFTPAVSAEVGLGTVLAANGTTGLMTSMTGSYRVAVPKAPAHVFATAGLATTYLEDSTSDSFRLSPVVGIGAEYALNPRLSVRADYRVVPSFGATSNRVEFATLGLKSTF
jgi:hypothetical protein